MRGGRREGSGRKAHEPTEQARQLVRALVIAGWDQEKIAPIAGLADSKSLRKYYRNELDLGRAHADAAVTKSLLMQAVGGPEADWKLAVPSATIFYAKTRMGWKEVAVQEHSGLDGEPIKVQNVTDEMRARALAAFIAKTMAEADQKKLKGS